MVRVAGDGFSRRRRAERTVLDELYREAF